jgi:Transposase IS66 family
MDTASRISELQRHLPLYRQSAIAARENVTPDIASMGRWVGMCEALLDPLAKALRRYAMGGAKLHADDTAVGRPLSLVHAMLQIPGRLLVLPRHRRQVRAAGMDFLIW